METLRILWLNHRDPKHPEAGGAEVHLWEVSRRIASLGHEITIFSERFKGAPKHETLGNIEIYRSGNRISIYPNAVLNYFTKFRGHCDLVVDDIAHAIPWFTPLYVREPVIAIIHHVHREILNLELPQPYARIARIAEGSIPRIYRNVPFITVSESTKNALKSMGIPESSISVIPLGIDQNRYKPNWRRKSPFPHILYLGRIKKYKNIDHILEVVKLAAKETPNLKFSIAGKGDKSVIKALLYSVRRMGLKSIVKFHGEVTEEEKIRLLQKAWIYVTASMREGWGLSVIEAAACGTPAVAYNVEGLRDSILNGKTGLLAPYGDKEALAELIIRILKDDRLRRRLSQAAIKWAKSFSWDETAKRTLKVFAEAAASLNQISGESFFSDKMAFHREGY